MLLPYVLGAKYSSNFEILTLFSVKTVFGKYNTFDDINVLEDGN